MVICDCCRWLLAANSLINIRQTWLSLLLIIGKLQASPTTCWSSAKSRIAGTTKGDSCSNNSGHWLYFISLTETEFGMIDPPAPSTSGFKDKGLDSAHMSNQSLWLCHLFATTSAFFWLDDWITVNQLCFI